jgi:predicted nucleic acid-binding protein
MGTPLAIRGPRVALVFVDANILIYQLEENPSLGPGASARLAVLREAGDQVVVSDLVRLECRVGPLKSGDVDLLARYDGFFSHPDIQVAGLTATVCDRATMIRARHGFRTPDALNLAAALESGCACSVEMLDCRVAGISAETPATPSSIWRGFQQSNHPASDYRAARATGAS